MFGQSAQPCQEDLIARMDRDKGSILDPTWLFDGMAQVPNPAGPKRGRDLLTAIRAEPPQRVLLLAKALLDSAGGSSPGEVAQDNGLQRVDLNEKSRLRSVGSHANRKMGRTRIATWAARDSQNGNRGKCDPLDRTSDRSQNRTVQLESPWSRACR